MKAWLLIEFETRQTLATAVDKGRVHDFKLLKQSRLPFVPSQLCLAERDYQEFAMLHTGTCTPTNKPRKQSLADIEKQHNRALARLRVQVEQGNSSLQDLSDLLRVLPQSKKAVWLASKPDC